MPMMKCCAQCFGDRSLEKDIFPSLTSELGDCSYCGEQNVLLLIPSRLREHFAPLITIYVADPAGKLLVEWLKDDWGIFDHPRMDIPNAKGLLADILDNGEIVREKFSPSERFRSDGLDRWEKLRNELMYTNRYFPDSNIDEDRLESHLSQLRADDLPKTWFRARLQQGDVIYNVTEMGAPPKRVTSHGRANPPGIPYLYLGSTEETAISEVRPHTGETACVADFSIGAELVMIDLRNPKKLISPFVLGDEDQIGAMRGDVPFLQRLGEELTRPVLPQGAAIDYVPSQYLCEFIKKAGYDGVIYRSSVSSGMNLALFDPAKATPGAVQQRKVSRVSITVE
jgi:hypothetical protein